MQKFFARPFSYLGAFTACFFMSITTGCASGGFKLTREYAHFVNSQTVIIRVVLYILTFVVFFATMLIDMVFNNTLDFWSGRVSAGDYHFQGEGKTYQVRHEFQGDTKLRRSTINIYDEKDQKLLQKVVLNETSKGEIEFFVDGKLRTRVQNISDVPVASFYGQDGQWISNQVLTEEKLAGF